MLREDLPDAGAYRTITAFLERHGRLREAFANVYAEVAQDRMARSLGEAPLELPYPRIEDGAHTMAFIEACVASQARGCWVEVAKLPPH